MEAKHTTRHNVAGVASAASTDKETMMTEPAATKSRTRKPAAKAETPEVAKDTKAAPEKKTYEATGRSGQVSTKTSTTPLRYAVDVKRPGRKATYAEGIVCKFFATKDAAEAFAERVNAKDGSLPDFYTDATDATVVPAKVQAVAE